MTLKAETVRIPVTRDLWISSAQGEEEGNNGAAPRLKVKGYQEFSILDFDVTSLRGKRIERATLFLKRTGDERLYRVGVSSITSEWVEGVGTSYAKEDGASSFRWRINPSVPWINDNISSDETALEYNDVTSVIFGLGGSIWSNSEATEPEDDWQSVALDPDLVSVRANGLSYGFVIFDDTGTELERNDEDVNIRLFPNRFVFSKDQNLACAPFLEVEYSEFSEKKIPKAPNKLSFCTDSLSYGEVILSWEHTSLLSDEVLGFFLSIDGNSVPQALVPQPILAESPIEKREYDVFQTRLSGLDPSVEHTFTLTAISKGGIVSKPVSLKFKASVKEYTDWNSLVVNNEECDFYKRFNENQNNLKHLIWNNASISIVDEFIKFSDSGQTIPTTPSDYLLNNSIWNSSSREIRLYSAKNEFIGFQIVFNGEQNDLRFSITWEDVTKSLPTANFYRFTRVETPKGEVIDPVLPLAVDEVARLNKGIDSVYCELLAPNNLSEGEYRGRLLISDLNGNSLFLPIRLYIWNFAIPNELCFLAEMNCYSLPENEREYYRLAQLHRTYINRVPYSHRGSVGDGLAPLWDKKTKRFNWIEWEKRYRQYFDGSAFADLPRGAIPIEAFYLPLFENYPSNIFEGFKGVNTWPNENAFTQDYLDVFREGVKQFANKIDCNNWNKTTFQFFLNNKLDYKRNGWSKASSLWLLDEPASYRDFAALQFFGKQLKQTFIKNSLSETISYRADISRPQWERNSLDSILDVYVVSGGAFKDCRRIVLERCKKDARFLYIYGTTAAPHESAYQPILWVLDSWALGADGVVPWQTIGNSESWKIGDELSLFYPATEESRGKVVASIRLKSYRRAEQDVEYLNLFLNKTGCSREELGNALRKRLLLDQSVSRSLFAEDAGTFYYDGASPDSLQFFRIELGKRLNQIINEEKEQ